MNLDPKSSPAEQNSRRDFLQKLGAMAAVAPVAANAAALPPMPQVRFGKHMVSRLIIGGNTLGGLSHLSRMIDLEMSAWHTPERLNQTFKHCEELGINCMESGRRIPKYNEEMGGKMLFTLRNQAPLDESIRPGAEPRRSPRADASAFTMEARARPARMPGGEKASSTGFGSGARVCGIRACW